MREKTTIRPINRGPEWRRRYDDRKPSRCPDCGPGTLILIRDRGLDTGGGILWYCCTCGRDFFRREVEAIAP